MMSFSVGALLATLITYCCCVKRGKSSGQPHPSTSEGPQPVPVYDEVGACRQAGSERECFIWSSGDTGDETKSLIWSCEALDT